MVTAGTNAGSMTRECLEAIFTEYGDRIKVIKCNPYTIFVNTPIAHNTFTLNDIKFKTVGIVDYMEVKQYNTMNGGFMTVIIPLIINGGR